jgi:hypothetical protein
VVKKTLWLWATSLIVGFYTAFVLQRLWNWFAVPALHVPSIGYWLMFGLNTLIGLIFQRGETFGEDQRWKVVMTVLAACVPDGKQAKVQETLEQEMKHGMWVNAGSMVVDKIVGNTFALSIGWAIHTALIS